MPSSSIGFSPKLHGPLVTNSQSLAASGGEDHNPASTQAGSGDTHKICLRTITSTDPSTSADNRGFDQAQPTSALPVDPQDPDTIRFQAPFEPRELKKAVEAFEASTLRFQKFAEQFKQRCNHIAKFACDQGFSKSQMLTETLESLHVKLFGTDQANRYANPIVRGHFYDTTPDDLDLICASLGDPRLSVQEDGARILNNLATDLLVCGDGTHSNLHNAAREIHASLLGIHGNVQAKREALFLDVIRAFCDLHHGTAPNYAGMETHYVNAYRKRFNLVTPEEAQRLMDGNDQNPSETVLDRYGIPEEPDEYIKFVNDAISDHHVQTLIKLLDQEIQNPVNITARLAQTLMGYLVAKVSTDIQPCQGNWSLITDFIEEQKVRYGSIGPLSLIEMKDENYQYFQANRNDTLVQLDLLSTLDNEGLITSSESKAAQLDKDHPLYISENISARLVLGWGQELKSEPLENLALKNDQHENPHQNSQKTICAFQKLLWCHVDGDIQARQLLRLDHLLADSAESSEREALEVIKPRPVSLGDFSASDRAAIVIEGLRNTTDKTTKAKFQHSFFPRDYGSLKESISNNSQSREHLKDLLVSLAELSSYINEPITSATATSADELATKLASRDGIFSFLIQNGANLHEAFREAMHHRYDGAVQVLLQYLSHHAPGLAIRDEHGRTLLHLAAECGNFNAVRQLLELGVDVNAGDKYKRNALHFIAASSDAKPGDSALIVAYLQVHGADIQARIDSIPSQETLRYAGLNPLDIASRLGNAEVVGHLLQSGASVNVKDPIHHQTALQHAAAFCRNRAVFEQLLKAGAQTVYTAGEYTDNALVTAVRNNNLVAVTALLAFDRQARSRGQPVFAFHQKTADSLTVVELAIRDGYSTVIDQLLRYPAVYGVKADDESERSICRGMHRAVRCDEPHILKILLDCCPSGAQRQRLLNSKSDTGDTLLHQAARSLSLNTLKYFIELKRQNLWDPDLTGSLTKTGYTALHILARQPHSYSEERVCNFAALLINGLDMPLEAKSSTNGQTALLLAALNARPLLVRVLMQANANANAPLNWVDGGGNALHILAKQPIRWFEIASLPPGEQSLNVMVELLRGPHPIDINQKNNAGLTPLMVAVKENQLNLLAVIEFLIRMGADTSIRDNGPISRTALERAQGPLRKNRAAADKIQQTIAQLAEANRG